MSSAIDLSANHCFGCGTANPQGLHLHFSVDASDPVKPKAEATVTLTRLHEGGPGHVHGGIIATLLDEAMSKLSKALGVVAVTRHMEIDYVKPVPLFARLTVRSEHLRREGRKLFYRAEVAAADGTVLATAKGFFLTICAQA